MDGMNRKIDCELVGPGMIDDSLSQHSTMAAETFFRHPLLFLDFLIFITFSRLSSSVKIAAENSTNKTSLLVANVV